MLQSIGSIKNFFVADKPVLSDTDRSLFTMYDDYRSDPLGFEKRVQNSMNDNNISVKNIEDFIKIAKHYKIINQEQEEFLRNAEKIPGTIKEGQRASEAYVESFQSGLQKLGTGIINVGKTLVSTLGKAAISALLMYAVTEIIDFGKYIWDNYITDNAIVKKQKELAESLNESADQLRSNKKTYDELSKKYVELSRGVDAFGHNISLTDEKYTQYKETVSQLIELNPNLIQGYNDQGEAILTVRDDVNELTAAYYENIKAANSSTIAMSKTILSNAKSNRTKQESESTMYQVSQLEKWYNGEETADSILSAWSGNYGYEYSRLLDVLKQLNIISDDFDKDLSDEETTQKLIKTLETLTSEQRNAIKGYIDRRNSEFESVYSETRELFHSALENTLLTNPEFSDLSDNIKTTLLNTISNVKYNFFQQFSDMDQINAYINNLLTRLDELSEEDQEKFTVGFNLSTTFNNNEISYGEYLTKIEEIKSIIETLFPGDSATQETVFKLLGFDTKKMDNQVAYLKKLMGDNYTDDVLNHFTKSELERISDIQEREFMIGVTPIINQYSLEEIKKELEEISPVEVEIDIKSTDAVEDLDALKKSFSGLDTVYQKTVNESGIADAADIQSVNSNMGGVYEEKDGERVYTTLSTALESYNDQLVENAGDSEAAQTAVNHLATAYIDLGDKLINLTEDNKELYIEQLKNEGVINAEEVVLTRLSKRAKITALNLKTLAQTVAKHRKELDEARAGGENAAKAYESLVTSVSDLLSVYDDSGNVIEDLIPNIDADFIENNFEDIEAAISGDINALNRLRVEASKKIIITPELYDDAFYSQANDLLTTISNLDTSKFTIGGFMDNSDILNKLAVLRAAFKGSATEFAKFINTITGGAIQAVVDYDYITVDDAIARGKKEGVNTKAWENITGQAKTYAKIAYPKEIKYKWNGNSSGDIVNYGGTSTIEKGGGDGGGGNSGSGNKAKDEADETFDWIEVRIQRLDEEITRLDKTVGNTYTTWSKRNSALGKEIKKVTEEIKAHQHAYDRYLKNAEAVKVNSGKELKKDDYGTGEDDLKEYNNDLKLYNKAVAEWKTGKYQKLVKEGKLGPNDIEKIGNKFLSDTIKEYQELYNKAVAMGDAIQDDQIKLGDLNKTSFDNVKSEFEGIIGLFEDASTIIDKQIERTEEHGYFVSANYYKKQKEITEKVLAEQRTEYAKLEKARDAAVANGSIKKYSEAWYNMTSEINATEAAINDTATALVKFDNQLRQLKWDAFDYALGRLDMITTEAEFLNDLLNSQPLFEEDGNYTDRGQASSTLIGIQFDTAMKKAQEYGKAIKEVQADLAKDPNNKNLLEQLEEFIKAQQDAIKNAKSLEEAHKDLVSEGINKHLEFLQKLIDKYKESLSDAKDLASYQKTINEQTKNISSLERQLAAYAGDDSEEARATIQKLTESLEDARNNLQETEWDKYISETNDMLDDMYEDYSELLNKRLDNIDELFTWGINDNNKNSENLQTTLNDVATQYGYDITSNFDKIIGSGGTTISDFNQTFTDASASTLTVLSNIYNTILEMAKGTAVQNKVVNEGNTGMGGSTDIGGVAGKISANISNVEASKKKAGWKKDSIGWWYQNADGTYPEKKWENIGDKWYYFNDEGYMVSNAYQDGYWLTGSGAWDGQKKAGWKKDKKGWWYQYANGSYPKNRFLQIDGKMYYFDEKGYMVTGEKTIQGQKYVFGSDGAAIDQQDFTKVKKGYATGTSGIRSSQMAWTQENGSELIYRATDGAILTPLSRGDMVFTNDMSKALWNLAKNPGLAGRSLTLPSINGTARTINNENEITLVLPNVTNYEEFKSALTKDPKFVNFVQATTIGQALGKGRLNRGNF